MDTSFTRRNNYNKQNEKNNKLGIGDKKTWKKYIRR